MARQQGNGTIIIKKIKKGGHGAHHGGAWKVAYADFVTAMMAFFLLLWLLNVTTDVQKRGIADYFEPTISAHSENSGSGGVLGGRSIGKPGSMQQDAVAPSVAIPIPAERQPDEGDEGEESGSPVKMEKADGSPPSDKQQMADQQAGLQQAGQQSTSRNDADDFAAKLDKITEAAMAKSAAEREERQFAAAEFALRQAMQDIPDLKNLAENLVVDRTQEGLRIQIVDQDKTSMFPLGSAEMAEPAKKLMALVTQVVQRLPNQISVSGHTDSTPFARAGNYGNWELSADRANASRRALLASGLPAERIAKVVGVADRDPMVADQPNSPRNRRISMILLHADKGPNDLAAR
ncbi:MAG TPA: flagellar motor protein MotB [Stellaceae bacterium]|jgi:chemotaxis protein MotB|nr:flagellar motor protein MotB [Stellaceae bacterium]